MWVILNLHAMDTLQGEMLLVAGQAIVVFPLDKAPRANRQLAAVTCEAVIMPAVAPMLHLPGSWQREKERERTMTDLWLRCSRNSVPAWSGTGFETHTNQCHFPI